VQVLLLDHADHLLARRVRPWHRLLVRLRAGGLDRALADGASPEATVALAVRAHMLATGRARADLAGGARRIALAAAQPPASGRPAVPVCLDRVRASAPEFGELISRLLAGGLVPARGIAQASILLGDARGPLYHRASRDDLRARIRQAADALDPLSVASRPAHGRPGSPR
jgi:hypothetical protein